ncbi:MAG: hypothetical protein WA865_04330 [Spirulinaceae cyanobacterium]
MQIDWLGFIVLFLLTKSGEIILEQLLTKFWQWVLSETNIKQLILSCKLQILVIYLDWLLERTPVEKLGNKDT